MGCAACTYLAKEKSQGRGGREAVRIPDRLRNWLSLALLLVRGACGTVNSAGFLGRP